MPARLSSSGPWIVLAAAVVEAAVGYPDALHRRAPHPVVWIGGLISSTLLTLVVLPTLYRWFDEKPTEA